MQFIYYVFIVTFSLILRCKRWTEEEELLEAFAIQIKEKIMCPPKSSDMHNQNIKQYVVGQKQQ